MIVAVELELLEVRVRDVTVRVIGIRAEGTRVMLAEKIRLTGGDRVLVGEPDVAQGLLV